MRIYIYAFGQLDKTKSSSPAQLERQFSSLIGQTFGQEQAFSLFSSMRIYIYAIEQLNRTESSSQPWFNGLFNSFTEQVGGQMKKAFWDKSVPFLAYLAERAYF